MTIEIQRPSSKYQFKQHEDNPREIWWRIHKRGHHWKKLQTYDTPKVARQRMLEIEKAVEQ